MDNIEFKGKKYYFTSKSVILIHRIEFDNIAKKRLLDEPIEIQIYLNILGAEDDTCLWFIPSILDRDSGDIVSKKSDIKELDNRIEDCYDYSAGICNIDVQKIVEIIKKFILEKMETFIHVLFDKKTPEDDKNIIREMFYFTEPWLIEEKIIRKHKLKKLKNA